MYAINQTTNTVSNAGFYTGQTRTIQASNDGYVYIGYFTSRTNYDKVADGTYYFQVEIKSTATTYEPYTSQEQEVDLGDIEYCKIGTYADRIFKNVSSDPDYSNEREEGAWYIKKNIGKDILNGSETWSSNNDMALTNTFVYSTRVQYLPQNQLGYSNYFKRTTGWSTLSNTDEDMYQIYTDRWVYVRVNSTIAPDLASFKTWLSTHNTTVYYILATPTYTQITGTLAEQLEQVYKNMLSQKGQTNISQVNNDLSFNMSVQAIEKL